MRYNLLTILLATLTALGVASCDGNTQKSSATEGSFTMVCDNSFENVMELEIDVFEFDYPKVNVLNRYVPYSEALDSLLSLNTKTAVLPRDLTQQERDVLKSKGRTNVRSRQIAVDAVALIVNPRNSIEFLSMDEIKDILTGQVRTWYDLDPSLPNDTIRLLFDSNGSSMVAYMRDSLINGAELGPNAYGVGSVQAVIDGVRDRRNAIGVIGVSWLTSDLRKAHETVPDSLRAQISDDIANGTVADGAEINARTASAGVKVLGVRRSADDPYTDTRFMKDYDEFRAYKPFQTEIYKGYYPLTRSIYLVTSAYSDSPAGGFYSFVTGEIGQRILQRTGVMPAVFRTQVVELVE